MTKEKLSSIIQSGKESALVDFKRKFYDDLKNSDMPKDIAAFANSIVDEPKVIVFGVEDETRNPVGIESGTFVIQDTVDDYITKTIEPFVSTEVGTFVVEDVLVGYIEILDSNHDYPYMIKKDCGPGNRIKQGDIFVRKGTSIQKATREDLDRLKKKGNFRIRIHDSISIIEPICFPGEIPETPTCGRIDLEFFNETSIPVLIDDGYIEISSSKYSTCQRVFSILPNRNIRERPFEVAPITRKAYTLLYTFTSTECVKFGFDVDGELDDDVKIKIMLKDTDENIYESDEKELMIKVKGDILHKVWLMNKQNCKKKKNLKR